GIGRTTLVTLPDGYLRQTRFLLSLPGDASDDQLPPSVTHAMEETAATDENGHTRRSYADGAGRVGAVKAFFTAANVRHTVLTSYGYDPLGNLTTVTDAQGGVTTAAYDSLGRMVTLASRDAGTIENRYALNGLLTEKQT